MIFVTILHEVKRVFFAEKQAARSPYWSNNCHTYSYNFTANQIWDNIGQKGCWFREFGGIFEARTIMFLQRGCDFQFKVNSVLPFWIDCENRECIQGCLVLKMLNLSYPVECPATCPLAAKCQRLSVNGMPSIVLDHIHKSVADAQ